MDRIDRLIAKAGMGDITPDERAELEDALMGLAPSDPRFKAISSAVRGSGLPQQQGPDLFDSIGGALDSIPIPDPLGGRDPVGDALRGIPDPLGGWDPIGSFLEPAVSGLLGQSGGGPGRPTPAAAADAAGGLPNEVERESFGLTPGDSGSTSATSGIPGVDYGMEDIMADVPQGYSFSDVAPGMFGMVRQNPQVMLDLMYGESPAMQGAMAPYLEAANTLSGMGVLGQGGSAGGDTGDLMGGPEADAYRMAAMEDFLRQMEQPGMQFVDPGQAYGQVFNRTMGTEFEDLRNDQGMPFGPEETIAMTNQALFAVNPFMTEETAAMLSSRLEEAAVDYLGKLARGETQLTYPKYLESIGAGRWIQ